MSTSILAIVGPFLAIMAIAVLLNFKYMMKMMDEMMLSKSMLFMMGFITLLIGLIIVTQYAATAPIEMLLVTIFGWAATIKGFMLMVFPKHLKKFASTWMKHTTMMKVRVFIMALIGLWMTWIVYI